jgi:hypothetical protein
MTFRTKVHRWQRRWHDGNDGNDDAGINHSTAEDYSTVANSNEEAQRAQRLIFNEFVSGENALESEACVRSSEESEHDDDVSKRKKMKKNPMSPIEPIEDMEEKSPSDDDGNNEKKNVQ